MTMEFAERESIWDCRVECVNCGDTIDVSVFAFESRATIIKQSLNELLVDFGWLPTAFGGYCRQHAAAARRPTRG